MVQTMEEPVLYKRIAADIRRQILNGQFKPGDRLPSIRELTRQWNCTQGTIQRAYAELSSHGLISGRAGQGTRVSPAASQAGMTENSALRRAHLVHRAEAFILEALVAGQSLDEIQQAVSLAMDRWRAGQPGTAASPETETIRFTGSHDMAVTWLAAHITDALPGVKLEMNFSGSLGGLMALAEGHCDLAGCHLLDATSGEYNVPYIRSLFPGQRMALVHLAERSIGLIVAPGNPMGISGLQELTRPGLRVINRQAGSGTRVYLDEQMRRAGISPDQVQGYSQEVATHSQVALAVAEGQADAGLGLQSAASAYQLGFIPLVSESYDLVAHAQRAAGSPLQDFFAWLGSPDTHSRLAILPGYDFSRCGELRILEL